LEIVMLRMLTAAALVAAFVQPAAACTVGRYGMPEQEWRAALDKAPVAFLGTVVGLRDRQGVVQTDPKLFRCDYRWEYNFANTPLIKCNDGLFADDMASVIFRVEEPIRGVQAGTREIPQGQSAGCGIVFVLGTRYLFGGEWAYSPTWVVPPGMTAAQATQHLYTFAVGPNARDNRIPNTR
jgi:hypothetical protein